MPISFRYSALDTAHRCFYKYKRIYVDGATPDGLDSGDTHFGSAIHAGLEALLTGNNGLQTFRVYWDSMKERDIAYSRLGWAPLSEVGEKLLMRFERLHQKHFVPFMLEQTLTGKFGRHTLTGTPDYLGLYKGKRSIVDFKTANRDYVKDKILVAEQMPIYAELARQAHDYYPEQLVYYVFNKLECKIQTLTLPVTDEWLQSRLPNVIAMCDELEGRTEFPKNPTGCLMGTIRCPFFTECHGA